MTDEFARRARKLQMGDHHDAQPAVTPPAAVPQTSRQQGDRDHIRGRRKPGTPHGLQYGAFDFSPPQMS